MGLLRVCAAGGVVPARPRRFGVHRTISVLSLALVTAGALSACEGTPAQRTTAALRASSERESLPRLGTLTEFRLLDQRGRPFTRSSLAGKVSVAAFMFTRCPTICPMMTARMKSLQEQAAKKKVPLHLVSFSVDSDNDTPEVLSAYATKNAVDTNNWSFVTGDSEAIRETAERGFKIGVEGKATPGDEHFGITHGTHLVLVDSDLQIRGYYQSSDPERVKQLLADARRLATP